MNPVQPQPAGLPSGTFGGRRSARAGTWQWRRLLSAPHRLAFWGGSWTIGGWCRLRSDFRNFRPDRIVALTATGKVFTETKARGLEAYLQAVGMRGEMQ